MKATVLNGKMLAFCCVIIGMMLSCSSPDDGKIAESPNITNSESTTHDDGLQQDTRLTPESGTVSNDSVYLSGSYILFFGPSADEISTLQEKGNVPPGYAELISEADRLRKYMEDTLSAMNVPLGFSYSEAGTVCITMDDGNRMYFNRRSLKFPAGMIMMDGMQPPAIRSANSNVHDYYRFVRDFFVNIDFPEASNPNV